MGKEWELAWEEEYPIFSKLKELVPDYSYEDSSRAVATDEKVCGMFLLQIERCRDRLFDIVQTSYELAKENRIGRHFECILDDLEVLADEVKVKEHGWESINREALKLLVRLDYFLYLILADIESALAEIFGQITHYKELQRGAIYKAGGKITYEKDFWSSIRSLSERLEEGTDLLQKKIREREKVFGIKKEDIEDLHERIHREIRAFEKKYKP